MKKKVIAFAICLIIGIVGFQAGRMVEAGSNEPGSQSDPLVTKSYVDEKLSGAAGGLEKLTLAKGDEIMVRDGAMVVLYKGSASIESGVLLNLSEGSTFENGNSLVLYNSFLAAGDVKISIKGKTTLYVGGDYQK